MKTPKSLITIFIMLSSYYPGRIKMHLIIGTLLFSICAVIASATPALAEIIRFDFEGEVCAEPECNVNPSFGGGTQAGDTVSGSIVFDSTAVGYPDYPSTAYEFDGSANALLGITMSVGTANVSIDQFTIKVSNDGLNNQRDTINFDGISGGTMFYLQLIKDEHSMVPDESLPLTPPDLDPLDWKRGAVWTAEGMTEFHLTSLTFGGIIEPGSPFAWGLNSNGQLGDGSTDSSSVPVQVSSLTNVQAIAAGTRHTLALKGNGTVWAWGWDSWGELGVWEPGYCPTFPACPPPRDETSPLQVRDLTVGNSTQFLTGVSAIAAGVQWSAALKADGTVLTWGRSELGQLGRCAYCYLSDNSWLETDYPAPVEDPTDPTGFLTDVAAIAAGGYHCLALKADGTVWAWGNNGNGSVGDGTRSVRRHAVQVIDPNDPSGFLTGVEDIAAGLGYSLALKVDPGTGTRTVWAWGRNNDGELGYGSLMVPGLPYDDEVPFSVWPLQVKDPNDPSGFLTAVATIAAGGGNDAFPGHSLAVKTDGRVLAWGYNADGQLGDGTTTTRFAPVQVLGPGGEGLLDDVIAIAANRTHSLAALFDGTVWAWGDNSYGQLGNGCTPSLDCTNSSTPLQVPGLAGMTAVAAGGDHSLATGGPVIIYEGLVGSAGGTVVDAAGTGATFTVEPGALGEDTRINIEVLSDLTEDPPPGYMALGTAFVSFTLEPNPTPPPILATITLPLVSPLPEGTLLFLSKFDPATGSFVVTSIEGWVDQGSETATFTGYFNFSIFVGLQPANQPPVAQCQDETVDADAACQASVTVDDVDAGSFDPDPGDAITLQVDPSVLFGVGPRTVDLVVTDSFDATASCSSTVTVNDIDSPAVSAPADVTLECGDPTDPVSTGAATGTDACDGPVTIASTDYSTAACGNTETITRTWTATDESGNFSSAAQTITVEDTMPPMLEVPGDVILECPADTGPTHTGSATGSDICGNVSIVFSDTRETVSGNDETITRTWTATDTCGLSTSGQQRISVVDTPPPVALCQDVSVVLDASGNAGITPGDVDYGSHDSCGAVSLALSEQSFTCADVGPNIVALSVTDENDNRSTCKANVTVADTNPPSPTATLVPIRLDDDEGVFRVQFSCSDACDSIIRTTANINGYPVRNRQRVRLAIDDDLEARLRRGFLRALEAPSIALEVTCTDASGNTAATSVSPPFPTDEDDQDEADEYEGDSDDDDQNDEDDDD